MDSNLIRSRFFENLLIGTAISVIFMTANYIISYTRVVAAVMSTIANVIFYVMIIKRLVYFRREIPLKRNYYTHNLVAAFLYGALAVVLGLVASKMSGSFANTIAGIYPFAFYIFKMPQFITLSDDFNMGSIISAGVSTALMLIITALVPLFVKKERPISLDEKIENELY